MANKVVSSSSPRKLKFEPRLTVDKFQVKILDNTSTKIKDKDKSRQTKINKTKSDQSVDHFLQRKIAEDLPDLSQRSDDANSESDSRSRKKSISKSRVTVESK